MKGFGRFIIIIAAFIIASCVQDLDGGKEGKSITGDGAGGGEGTVLVTLSLSTPALPNTRASRPGTALENHVGEVDVLLFKSGKYYYRAIAEIVDDGSPSGTTQEFRAKLPLGGPYNVVVIANAATAVKNVAPAVATIDNSAGIDRATLLNSIEWSEAGKMAVTGFPMFGERDVTSISETATTISTAADPLKMTRAVARLDVRVTTGDFALSSVYLYHRTAKGRVCPGASSPNIPSVTKEAGYLLYDSADGLTADSITGSIYTFESSVESSWASNTCLVIGGSYKGGTETFYRVDFVKERDAEPGVYDYMPLLRNGLYSLVISGVTGGGWGSAAQALGNKPANLVIEIINTSDLNYITFNDHNYLAVNRDHLYFYREVRGKSLLVLTDYYPGGWSVDQSTLPGWLVVASSASSGVANQPAVLTLEPVAELSSGMESGTFDIVAANLRETITVTRVSDGEFSLEVDPLELTFLKVPGEAQKITVTPYPAGSGTLSFDDTGLSTFSWETGFGIPADQSPAAPFDFYLRPVPNAGSSILSGTLLVTLTSSTGQVITRAINIRQMNHEINVAAPSPSGYLADGTSVYSIAVQGNVPWEATIEAGDDPDGLVEEIVAGSGAAPGEFKFKLAERTASSADPKTFTVTFKNPSGLVPAQTVTITSNALYLTTSGKASYYLADGAVEYSFTVNSNFAWTTSVTADANSTLASHTTTGAAGTSVAFKFKLKNRVSTTATGNAAQTATVAFTTPAGTALATETITSRRIYFVTTVAENYLADGTTTYSFTINTNSAWTATAGSGFLSGSCTTSGSASTSSTFSFKLTRRVNTSTADVVAQTATATFKTSAGTTLKAQSITTHAGYLTLSTYSYTTTNYAAHSFDVTMTTNIPTSSLSGTPSNSMITGATFPSSTILRVNVAANALTAQQTYTLAVKWGSTTMQTLSVTFPLNPFEIIDGKHVYKETVTVTQEFIQSGAYGACPYGSSLPSSYEDAEWYLKNIGVPLSSLSSNTQILTWCYAEIADIIEGYRIGVEICLYYYHYTYENHIFMEGGICRPWWRESFQMRCVVEFWHPWNKNNDKQRRNENE